MNVPEIDPSELAHLQDEAFFRLKGDLDIKVNQLFSVIKDLLGAELDSVPHQLPAELLQQAGRRFRGENYQGFPWRALDFPRSAQKPDLFIFRCLLLWGHDFSFHLILSGAWKARWQSHFHRAQPLLAEKGFSIDLQDSAWEWIPDPSCIHPLSELSPTDYAQGLAQHGHFKLTKRVAFDQFHQLPELALDLWKTIQQILISPA